MTFEDHPSTSALAVKPEVERSRRFVRQLRLLFLQLYKSEQAWVRPDEELAYLAITRPEVDEIVAPKTTIDSIPNVASPSASSTRVATPDSSSLSPLPSAPPSPKHQVLGKRASTDRDFSPRSTEERTRLKSEDFERVEETDDAEEDSFEMVPRPSEKAE